MQVNSIFNYKDAIIYISILELKVRYKGTILGFIWSVLEPLAQLVILNMVFTFLNKTGESFIIYLFLGLIMIQFFSRGTTHGMTSLFAKKPIILSINIPKMIFPVSSVLTHFWMFLIEIAILFGFVVFFHLDFGINVLMLVVVFGLLTVLTIGTSILISTVVLYFKDFQTIWGIITMSLIFITPVFWYVEDMSEYSDLFLLNPLATLIEMAHKALIFNSMPTGSELLYSISTSFGVFIFAYFLFKKTEKKFVELF
jgi:ABC-type polysaccharide/polyol phosphate export permease